MDTNTDEISPVEWLAGLEATNARQAADEYRKLGILFLVSHLPVFVSLVNSVCLPFTSVCLSLSKYRTGVHTAFSVLATDLLIIAVVVVLNNLTDSSSAAISAREIHIGKYAKLLSKLGDVDGTFWRTLSTSQPILPALS